MIRVEFRKQFWRLRTYLALGLMVVIPLITTIAFKLGGGPSGHGARSAQESLFELATRSGLNMPLAALLSVNGFLLPVVVSIFAGGAIAEEASWGTLRYLLLRPVSRRRLLATKLGVVAVFALIATLLVVLTGLVSGLVAFGWHPVVVPTLNSLSLATISEGDALSRLAVSTFYVTWSMAGVVAFAFMLSTVTDAALGAVSGGIGLTIVSEILDAIPPLKTFRNFLPTHYWQAWNGLFQNPVANGEMIRGALLQIPYAVAFLIVAWWWFHRKDVVS
ncbi:MAG: ABC transporter permease [Dehalococcoidia bacterium]|jgi:ABC-2 type transport system permease protein